MKTAQASTFFFIKDYFLLRPDLTYGGARNRYATAKKALGKAEQQYLTIEEIASYEGVATEVVTRLLSK